MSDRVRRLTLFKLLHHCVRVGTSPKSGPIFYLGEIDHTRDMFTARSVHTGVKSPLRLAELDVGLQAGIIHVSKVAGTIYHHR